MNIQKTPIPTEIFPPEPRSDAAVEREEDFGLLDFLRVVRVRYRIILGTALTIVTLVTIIVMQQTPLYSATAVVMLDDRKNNVESSTAVLSDLPSDQSVVENQVQILTSLSLAGRVVDRLKLEQDTEFNHHASGFALVLRYLNPLHWFSGGRKTQSDAQGQDLERSNTIHAFLSRVSADPISLSTTIKVSFQSSDASKAAMIANAIADAYVETQLDTKFEATEKATQWMSKRIAELARQAQLADAAVQQYKAAHNITLTPSGGSVLDQQIADINGQIILARTELAEKESTYLHLVSLAKEGHAADSASVMASPVIAALRVQETTLNDQIADLTSKYGPMHPKMLDLQAQKTTLDAKIAQEVQRFVDSAANDVGVAQAHVSSLQQSLRQLEAGAAGQNQAEVQMTALESAATSARAVYEGFLGRLGQTQGQDGIQTPDARIISNAEVPQFPSYPQKGLVIGISVLAGLTLGLMFAFAVERIDAGFRTTLQVERLLGIPVLSTIPEYTDYKGEAPFNGADVVVDEPLSSYSEAMRGLLLGLTLSNVDKKPKVIVVTSSVPDEGKTTVTVSLARMAARSGLKTVIVEGDLRRPSVARVMGLAELDHGLVDVLTSGLPLEQCLAKDPRSDAILLSCLHHIPHPADALGSKAMEGVIAVLSGAFDMVIVDSSPVLPVNDAKILSRLADSVLFVVRWEKTPREAVANALRSLAEVQAPIAGIALTRADFKRFQYYNYGYQNYYSYKKYYRT